MMPSSAEKPTLPSKVAKYDPKVHRHLSEAKALRNMSIILTGALDWTFTSFFHWLTALRSLEALAIVVAWRLSHPDRTPVPVRTDHSQRPAARPAGGTRGRPRWAAAPGRRAVHGRRHSVRPRGVRTRWDP